MNIEDLQHGILITNMAIAMDGGSLAFTCETMQNSKFYLVFTQYSFLDDPDPEMLPGRIYLNQNLVDLKSKDEEIILSGMKNLNVSNDLLENDSTIKSDLAETVDKLKTFFDSDVSLDIKKKVDKASKQASKKC